MSAVYPALLLTRLPLLLLVVVVVVLLVLPCSDTNLLVWGVDLVEEHLMCSVGIPARPPTARKPLVQVGAGGKAGAAAGRC
jgi:hypothetical protein